MAEIKFDVEEMVDALTHPRFLAQLAKAIKHIAEAPPQPPRTDAPSKEVVLYTGREAAKVMGWSHQTFYRTVQRLGLGHLRVGKKWPAEMIRKEWERLTASLKAEECAAPMPTRGKR